MSFDKDDQMERDGAYDDDLHFSGLARLACGACHARFRDDNSLAEHIGRHRKIARGDGSQSDHQTNARQAARSQAEELQEMLSDLRG